MPSITGITDFQIATIHHINEAREIDDYESAASLSHALLESVRIQLEYNTTVENLFLEDKLILSYGDHQEITSEKQCDSRAK